MSYFLNYIKKLNEMARQDRMPRAATPMDSSFISFVTHLPVDRQRQGGAYFWEKYLWEAAERRERMAEKMGVRPDQVKEGFGPEYIDFFDNGKIGKDGKLSGSVTRVYLKDPKTGESLVRHWAAPNRRIDPFARFFKVVEKYVGERGITGTIPDDPTTNASGHDLSGAYLDPNRSAYFNNEKKSYVLSKGTDFAPAHHSKETEMRMKHVGMPSIDYIDKSDAAMRSMATAYVAKKLTKDTLDKLKFVNFNLNNLNIVEPNGTVHAPRFQDFKKKSYYGIPVNYKHVVQSPVHSEEVNWEQMKKEGWQPRFRPTINGQERSFTAIRTNEKGQYESVDLYRDPISNKTFKTSFPLNVTDLGIKDGNFQYELIKDIPKSKLSQINQKGVEYSPLRIASSLQMIQQDFDGDHLPKVDRPEGETASTYGFDSYGGKYLNRDDPAQMKFEEPYQSAMVNLFRTRPELFGDDLDGYGDAPVRSIFTGFKKQDKKGDGKLSYMDVFNYVTNNIRNMGFWMGKNQDPNDENEMANYVNQLATFSIGKGPEPKMSEKVSQLLKAGLKWREGKAASKIHYDRLRDDAKYRTIQATGDEGDDINVVAQNATSDLKGNRSDKLGRNASDEDEEDGRDVGVNDRTLRQKKVGLDTSRNPEEFAKEEIQIDFEGIANTLRNDVRNKIQKINNVIYLKLHDMEEESKTGEKEIKQSISQIDSLLRSKEDQFIPSLQSVFGQDFKLNSLDPVKLSEKINAFKMAIRKELNDFIVGAQGKKTLDHKYMIDLYKDGTDVEFNTLIDRLDMISNHALYNNIPEFRQVKDQLRKRLAAQQSPQTQELKPSRIQQLMAQRKAQRSAPIENVPLHPNQNVPLKQDDDLKKAESFDFLKWFKKRDKNE